MITAGAEPYACDVPLNRGDRPALHSSYANALATITWVSSRCRTTSTMAVTCC